jgi:hypothetical protein
MGIFTSMMASKPFQYIKGISPGTRMAMGVGAAGGAALGMGRYTSRRPGESNQSAASRAAGLRPSMGNMVKGAGLGVAGGLAYANRGVLGRAASNLYRNPDMIKGVGQGLFQRAATAFKNVRRMI